MLKRYKELLEAFKGSLVFHSGCVSKDPLKYCELNKDKGCAHVDGFLCDIDSCTERKEYVELKENK